MIPALQQFTRFEKGSPSSEYQQIINFCVNYLEGMLIDLIYMDIPDELEDQSEQIKPLQQRLSDRERTVRHAFQFQVEKYFADFKSISRTRLKVNKAGLSDHKVSRIQDIIEEISEKHQSKHKNQLQNTARRLKTLVHRSDDNYDDNPVSPLNICRAFLASIETLNLSTQKNRYLLQLFDHPLNNQLGIFFTQIDLGLYSLDILAELTDPSLFLQPEPEIEEEPKNSGKVALDINDSAPEPVQAEPVDPIPVQPEHDKKVVTTIKKHVNKAHDKLLEIELILKNFKNATENGTLDFVNSFSQLSKKLSPLIEQKQRDDIRKYVHFFTGLLNNKLLSTPLKIQLSRLSSPLLEMVLVDPFFFRSSSHPVNDFLQSIIDFEIRFKHQGESLAILSQSFNLLLEVNRPSLSDYQPLIESYESFKNIEIRRLERLNEDKIQQQEKLSAEILQLVNDITRELVVDHDIMQFFYDDWQLLLLHLAQKLGKSSTEFKNSVSIAKMLSWFLNKNKTGFLPGFESTSFKSLLTSIETGLVALNFSSEHRHRIRKQLVKEYKLANKKETVSFLPSAFGSLSSAKPVLAHETSQNAGDNSNHIAKRLNIGSWVEIKKPSSKVFIRAKLKWKADDYSLFIFIDQRGHKIKECDLTELNQEFSSGNIKLVKKPAQLGSSFY